MIKGTMPIICGFPGTGKSFATEMLRKAGYSVSDSDSSLFDKKSFPQNYITHLEEIHKDYHFVFASSHKEVREALRDSGLDFIVIVPDLSLKDEYIKRYKKRGSSETFIKLISDNYESWISEIIEEGNKGLYDVEVFTTADTTLFDVLKDS